jgi:DNA-binding CsgD family transcriptional regulator
MAERRPGDDRRRAYGLAAVVLVQAIAATFFVGDALADIRAEGWRGHVAFEGLLALALVAGVWMGAHELRRLLARSERQSAALAVAQGALGELVEARFADWGLTPAEADVALFALKGCDTAEIAALRGAAPGTIRAQLTQVYAKAGVSNRAALVALFFDELLVGVGPPAGGTAP